MCVSLLQTSYLANVIIVPKKKKRQYFDIPNITTSSHWRIFYFKLNVNQVSLGMRSSILKINCKYVVHAGANDLKKFKIISSKSNHERLRFSQREKNIILFTKFSTRLTEFRYRSYDSYSWFLLIILVYCFLSRISTVYSAELLHNLPLHKVKSIYVFPIYAIDRRKQ